MDLREGLRGWEVDGIGSGPFPIAEFYVKHSGSTTTEFVYILVIWQLEKPIRTT
jgi:hypothetical protein